MAKFRVLFLLALTLLSLSAQSCKPRCPISSCKVRMVHRHGSEQEFRGQPIYRKQNPKMGEKLPRQKGEAIKRSNDNSNNKN